MFLLAGKQVVPEDFGIFLGTTWRMHPHVCSFISGAVYEDRLHAQPVTADRILRIPKAATRLSQTESGILYVPVPHEGNVQDSDEYRVYLAVTNLDAGPYTSDITLKDREGHALHASVELPPNGSRFLSVAGLFQDMRGFLDRQPGVSAELLLLRW